MAKPPAGYSLQRGAYFTDDGQGPYGWDGTSMFLLTGGGAGGAGGWGSDRTAGTFATDPASGEPVVATETVDGIPWTVGRDLLGREILRQWGSGGLSRAIDYSLGGGIASGNIVVHGNEIWVPSSAMATLKTQLAALGAAAAGAPRFYVYDFDGGRGLTVEWNYVNACFRGIGGAPLIVKLTAGATFTNPGTTPQVVFTGVVSAWLKTVGSRYNMHTLVDMTNETDDKQQNYKLNGSAMLTPVAQGPTINLAENTQIAVQSAVGTVAVSSFNGTGFAKQNSGSSPTQQSIAAGTDLTFTAESNYVTGGTAGVITLVSGMLTVINP